MYISNALAAICSRVGEGAMVAVGSLSWVCFMLRTLVDFLAVVAIPLPFQEQQLSIFSSVLRRKQQCR
jgi:hypothetical protein